jgi:ATP-binding cassette subfamily F protein 3
MQPRKNEERPPSANMRTRWHNEHICKVRFCPQPAPDFDNSDTFPAFIDKFRYNAAKSSEAQSRIKKLERMPVLEAPESEYVVHFKFPDVEKLSPPIIQMSGVAFGFTKDKPLLSNVDLDVQLDSRIGIVGPNGAGKTTVLKLLIGQLQPTKGLISQNPRLRVGYFAQHHVDALDLNDSAVGFMTKNYPGKTDEEYRRHLGA